VQEEDETMTHLGEHAIVIGASMGGLLAARALADYYDKVTILERDALPEADEPRKGVPRGRHAHGLLARGREALEELFPSFTEEMVARGALSGDIGQGVLWYNHGFYLCDAPTNLVGMGISRPMLEGGVRRRLLQFSTIELPERCEALQVAVEPSHGRVTGVRVQARGNPDNAETMSGDLVVDASGRGSASPSWLATLGYLTPREEQIKINVAYMTRQYRRPPQICGASLAPSSQRARRVGAAAEFWRRKASAGS
jgi:2-polyprenyl-6-methoxyphenol hydroxylase-like FAD-dependent oxidoreductase